MSCVNRLIKHRYMCLYIQTMSLVRLDPATPRFQVKHYTIEPLPSSYLIFNDNERTVRMHTLVFASNDLHVLEGTFASYCMCVLQSLITIASTYGHFKIRNI